MSEPCRIRKGVLGRWIILHSEFDYLAWTGARWSGSWRGVALEQYQICNFETELEAREYCSEHELVPIS